MTENVFYAGAALMSIIYLHHIFCSLQDIYRIQKAVLEVLWDHGTRLDKLKSKSIFYH
jgi:hypothetical protein